MIRAAWHRGQAGLTLIEAGVILSLLLIVSAMSYQLILVVTKASVFAESHDDLTALCHRVMGDIQADVMQAKAVFQEDAAGAGYRVLFTSALPPGIEPLPGSAMPILDASTRQAGNSLIVVKRLAPVGIPYDDDDAGAANLQFMAYRYQFSYCFLDRVGRKFGGFEDTLEPIRATSQIVADYTQLSGAVNRSRVVAGLRALSPPITMAWNPGKAVPSRAFYDLNASGTITSNSSPSFAVTTESLIPELAGGRISSKMTYSVARVGGLEFAMAGRAGKRLLLSRIVLASEFQKKVQSQSAKVVTPSNAF